MKRTKEEALLTRKLIIDSAVVLIKEKGLTVTTLDEIAMKANVTRGAIYWHFKDKLDIVDELIREEHEHMTHTLTELFEENISPSDKIRKTIGWIVDHFFENKSFQDFIDITWFKIEYSQLSRLKSTKSELTDYFFENFEELIKEAQRAGEVKNELSASQITTTITNMINGMYRLFFILPGRGTKKEEAMNSFTSYLNLIKTKS